MFNMVSEHGGVAGKAGIEIRPWPAAIGAEVLCGDVRALSDAAAAAVYRAWLDHLVLVFRAQDLTDEELLAFSRRFGENQAAAEGNFRPAGIRERDNPYIGVISNVVENGVAIGSLGFGEAVWHTDHSYKEQPVKATLLHAREVTEKGGETGFANMYAALETLPQALRERIGGRSIKNDMTYNSAGELRRGFTPVADVREAPGPSHPIVRTTETGHNALYLGRRPNAYVNGLPVAESEQLLDALWAHASQPCFSWHHKWRVGDIIVWDNRCAMHRRNPFDPAARRIMHRATVKGDAPHEDPAAQARGPHPRSMMVVS
jgi:taurine dioxygenase